MVCLIPLVIERSVFFQFFFHCSGYESLYEHVPREALPREYGGTLGSVEELTGECKGMQSAARLRLVTRDSALVITGNSL